MARICTINHLRFPTLTIIPDYSPSHRLDRLESFFLGCDGRMSVTVPPPPLIVRLQNPRMFCQLVTFARRCKS